MDDERSKRIRAFVDWVNAHVKGDEKGEAQVFLDRLLQAFGQPGTLDVGGSPEFRVRKSKEDGGGVSFADYVWKPVVLIEMKKRGEDLSRHLSQAFDYWVRLVPNRPEFTILCNFDEFRIYEFNKDLNEPQDTLALAELPDRFEPLNFLFPTREPPRYKVNRLEVTRGAADLLSTAYRKLAQRQDVGRDTAQRFILQMLIALFSEDIGLGIPKGFVTQLLEECTDPPKAFDLLNGLFTAMSTSGPRKGGRFKEVPYFNGGIFAQPAPVELASDEWHPLRSAARDYNWAYVSPDIFGTIFQHSMSDAERHKYGGHYTAPTDIMKIVGPTIVQPWRAAIAAAKSLPDLRKLQQRLYTYQVLDPACGSGNFLYIAYRELKRIETELAARIAEASPKDTKGQRAFGFVTTKQFFGLDIVPFAVELAKVTLTIAHKLAIDELHVEENALPLDNLDQNIRCVDALIDWPVDGSTPADLDPEKPRPLTPWPPADAIIGNPPFLGPKDVKPERGPAYVKALRRTCPAVPGMADYCVHWFRRAHDHLPACSNGDPLGGRAGLVGTQNIRNNQSRVGGLDHIAKSGVIIEAVESQPWSGEANVHVSIANWVKVSDSDLSDLKSSSADLLLPTVFKLWHKVAPALPLFNGNGANGPPRSTVTTPGKRGKPRADKSYELALRETSRINSALSDVADVADARVLSINTNPQRVFQGNTPGHDGFVLPPSAAKKLVSSDPASKKVVFPYLIGRELVSGAGRPERSLIDFARMDQFEARRFRAAFKHIEDQVLPDLAKKARAEKKRADGESVRQDHLQNWWRHWRDRADRVAAVSKLRDRYIACSRVTKRPVFVFVSAAIRPGDALQTFAFDDDYSFGILQSDAHWQWFIAKCSKLTERFRYTPESVFDTFPWPQSPTEKHIRAIARAGLEIRRVREQALKNLKGGLRVLYRTLELPGKNKLKDAHAALDAAVLNAYGFSPQKDLLTQLLDLNFAVAARIEKGQPATAPGVPTDFTTPKELLSPDCIKP